jgi:AcrR family transcriptional regulator
VDDPGKGVATRQRILRRAVELASNEGLERLTIGGLASDLGLSKSGLFAHFKSKERLQLDVLEAAALDFATAVFHPALGKPRGLPRLDAIFENWLGWIRSNHGGGGCIFLAAASEWDDRDGEVRDALVHWFSELEAGLVKATQLAIREGHLRPDLDAQTFASDLHATMMKYHLDSRLLRLPLAATRARDAFARLLEAACPVP